ncbi:MAG: hypothetical protein EBR09_12030 [Proteobacteria bacterium]|jgi:hypothetical protein|nr:hypothetical protein [Pseudomonadota bacterium]
MERRRKPSAVGCITISTNPTRNRPAQAKPVRKTARRLGNAGKASCFDFILSVAVVMFESSSAVLYIFDNRHSTVQYT